MSDNFAEMFAESLVKTEMRPGTIVMGTVMGVGQDVVVINAGLKSEGGIPIEEFFNERGEIEVQVGDEVEVSLDAVADGFGETRLSREKAKRARAWSQLQHAFDNQETITGLISGKVKGGFTVDIVDIRAFLPV